MKKLPLILALLCVFALLPAACFCEVELKTLFQYEPAVTAVNSARSSTGYLIIQANQSGLYGLYTTDGQEIASPQFASLKHLDNLLFSAGNSEKKVNRLALVDSMGHVCSDYAYASFSVLDSHWVLGYVTDDAREGTAESYDIRIGKKYYYAAQTDLFYVNEEQPSFGPVASQPGFSFTSVQTHGKYLSMADAEGKVTVYNAQFEAMPIVRKTIKTSVYGIRNMTVTDLVLDEPIAEGFLQFKEVSTADGFALLVSREMSDGSVASGVVDAKGNVLVPAEYPIYAVTNRYAVLSENDKKGLYSIERGRLLFPCVFDKILAAKNTADPYVTNGYVLVEDDGVRSYYDVEKGEIACTISSEYYETMTRVGCVCYAPTEGGYTLIAADGTISKLEADAIAKTDGDGYLLVAKRGEFYGVVDWHGNEVLPFNHKTAPVITQDSKAVIRVSTGSQVDQIIR